MQTSRGDGHNLSIVAPAALTSGIPFLFGGNTLVIPYNDAASGDVAAVETEGEHALPKVSEAIDNTAHTAAEALTAGQRAYWDDTNKVATGKALGPFIGLVVTAAADTAETVRIALRDTSSDPTGWTVAYLDGSDGLEVGAHAFVGPQVPTGVMPLRTVYEVIETFTSPTTDDATIALGLPTDGAALLKAPLSIDNGANPWDAGVHFTGPVSGFKTTAARSITATVGVEATTAGKMAAAVEWIRTGTFA